MKNMKMMAMTLALVAGIAGTAFATDIREIVGGSWNWNHGSEPHLLPETDGQWTPD